MKKKKEEKAEDDPRPLGRSRLIEIGHLMEENLKVKCGDWVKPYLIEDLARSLIEQGCSSEARAEELATDFWARVGATGMQGALMDRLDYYFGGNQRFEEIFSSVLGNLPRQVFEKLLGMRSLYLVVGEGGNVHNLRCPRDLKEGEEMWAVTICEKMLSAPRDIVAGLIAHELGHLFLEHGREQAAIQPHDRVECEEREADTTAIGWGFKEEIEAMRRLYPLPWVG